MATSEPGQNMVAAWPPCFSTLTHNGSPPHQAGSAMVDASLYTNVFFVTGSENRLATMP